MDLNAAVLTGGLGSYVMLMSVVNRNVRVKICKKNVKVKFKKFSLQIGTHENICWEIFIEKCLQIVENYYLDRL